jgi:hypothetical protein
VTCFFGLQPSEPAVIKAASRVLNINVLAFDKKGGPVSRSEARRLDGVDSGVALFSLGRELLLVHDFTTDSNALVNAIDAHGARLNQEVGDYTNQLRETDTAAALSALNDADIAVYSVDARRLE